MPHNIKVEPNIYVEVMEGQARNCERLRLWHEAGAKLTGIYGWDYASGESGFVLPRYYPHYVGNAWKKAYREEGLRGGWFEIGGRTSLYEGPRFYVLNELAWNINANIDALLDDYFSSFYAEAAVPMHQFYDRIEAIYGRMADPTDPRADCIWGGADFTAQYQEYTRADLTYLDNKLSEATHLAKDANAARRVALFRELWGLGELHVAAYLDARDLQAAQTIGDEAQITKTISTIRHSLTALDGIANYQISDDDQRLIFYKPGKDAMACFRQGAPIDVIVQREGDRNLDLATECLLREAKGDKQTIGAFCAKPPRRKPMPGSRRYFLPRSTPRRRRPLLPKTLCLAPARRPEPSNTPMLTLRGSTGIPRPETCPAGTSTNTRPSGPACPGIAPKPTRERVPSPLARTKCTLASFTVCRLRRAAVTGSPSGSKRTRSPSPRVRG